MYTISISTLIPLTAPKTKLNYLQNWALLAGNPVCNDFDSRYILGGK